MSFMDPILIRVKYICLYKGKEKKLGYKSLKGCLIILDFPGIGLLWVGHVMELFLKLPP
jgi:hypothetical protein